MKSYLSLLALLAISFAGHTEDTGMVPQLSNTTNPAVVESSNAASARKNSDLCQDLHKEMESLKGRPLRRNAVAQRYDLECRQRRP